MARIGILGGTFDPIHTGHLILAEETRVALALDRVLFVPAALPWRKADRVIAAGKDRLVMVELAIAGNPAFAASSIELTREGPTYTADTLEQLRSELGVGAELWFIIGADALIDLPYWKDPERILAQARLAVAGRPGYSLDEEARVERLLPGLRTGIDRVPMPLIEISSTELRRRVAQGISVRYRLPEAVVEYIAEQQLYRT
jgi:nicotinate-nucleotide adenylyltransferase